MTTMPLDACAAAAGAAFAFPFDDVVAHRARGRFLWMIVPTVGLAAIAFVLI